jgi:hypothetical protein
VILITVGKPVNPRAQYAQNIDEEVKHDAKRCCDALAKKYPGFKFFVKAAEHALGVYTVESEDLRRASLEVKAFAEGFMASEHLWER